MSGISLTLPANGESIEAEDVNGPFNAIAAVINGGIDNANISNVSGAKIDVGTTPLSALNTEGRGGWITGVLPAVSSVTENGNRSADITFASTVAAILTPGMRLRTSRSVAAPTFMGGLLNGTNHYFTRVTPSGTLGTITNNFTIMAWVEPTVYQIGVIAGRGDATTANGMFLRLESDGRISVFVTNAGGGNIRQIITVESLPLNKGTHVAATWTSGTVVIYINGIAVPTITTTSGTAPTTAGTGGDFSIGRQGANNTSYFAGYISGVGVFNAVLTQATIRSLKNQALLGNEANCIGAWSLNNTVNDQNAAANNLTAMNSAGFTARSPYTTDSNGVASGTYDWAIVQRVVGATATVQYPEGCAIPTSGGISTVDYSVVKNPFGMPVDEDRNSLYYVKLAGTSVASPAASAWVNANVNFTAPIGRWQLNGKAVTQLTHSGATFLTTLGTISTTNNSSSNPTTNTQYGALSSSSTQVDATHVFTQIPLVVTTPTPYYFNQLHVNGGASAASSLICTTVLFALKNAYL